MDDLLSRALDQGIGALIALMLVYRLDNTMKDLGVKVDALISEIRMARKA